MKEDEMFSVVLKSHIDFLKNLRYEYRDCEEKLKVCNQTLQDYLHSLELDDLNYKQRAKIATQIAKLRKERREYKDRIQILEPIVKHLDNNHKIIIEDICNIIGNIKQIETRLEERVYTNRVLDNTDTTEETTSTETKEIPVKQNRSSKSSRSRGGRRRKTNKG